MEKFEKIVDLKNEIEANLIEAILKEKKIPHIIKSLHDLALDGLFQYQKGWGYIQAPTQYKKDILEIYNEVIKSPE